MSVFLYNFNLPDVEKIKNKLKIFCVILEVNNLWEKSIFLTAYQSTFGRL